ncbi:28S ribosomal protein S5, mitochondrial [Neodiprion fabricii]|uniref:28S ribosomal protein S5, mitochondrial n=1 Tax=Neodiprion fabricii TaxID=2872261 RepID=UPI001ED9146B|nr:28S ribosomal protein S5, mitochondrial [Neodiprion fabricii]
MAYRIIRSCKSVAKAAQRFHASNHGLELPKRNFVSTVNENLLTAKVPLISTVRYTNFFNKLPAEALWKGVTSVSNAGRRRGRGKGLKLTRNLNRGQIIGVGKVNMVWPGLTAPVLRGKELIQQEKLPEDPERMAKLAKLRDENSSRKSFKIHPLDRGWSGSKLPGRSIGPPDPRGEETFEGFDTICLESKPVFNMSANMGRKRRMSVFVVTGNRNGLAGFALGKAVEGKAAVKNAKNRAGQRLLHVNIYNNHTVYHDFFSQFGKTKVFVKKQPEGYGLRCHRAIKSCCEMIGIKDLYSRIEGSTNLQHIIKAFFIGLLQQRTHSQIAEEKKLHLVEIKKETGEFPLVVASPPVVRKREEIKRDEILDYTQYVMNNRVVLQKKKFPPFYTKHRSWEIYLRRQEYHRNQDKVRIRLLTNYGELRSYLTDKYPEARPPRKERKPAVADA